MQERKTISAAITPSKDKSTEQLSATAPSRISKRLVDQEQEIQSGVGMPSPREDTAGGEFTSTTDPLKTAEILLQLLGEEIIRPLAENPHLGVPTPESAIAGEQESLEQVDSRRWLADLMRAFLTHQGLAQLQRSLESVNEEPQRLRGEIESLHRSLDEQALKHKETLQALEHHLSDANVQKKRLREQLQRTVPVDALAEAVFSGGSAERAIIEILKESMNDPTEGLGSFISKVCIGWTDVRSTLQSIDGDEEEKMQAATQALQRFMKRLSGHFVPERRATLKRIGEAVSTYFDEYDFASPEDWRYIEPAVHNAAGVGGQTVKEGLGFVVLRRSSGQTVVYADIITE